MSMTWAAQLRGSVCVPTGRLAFGAGRDARLLFIPSFSLFFRFVNVFPNRNQTVHIYLNTRKFSSSTPHARMGVYPDDHFIVRGHVST